MPLNKTSGGSEVFFTFAREAFKRTSEPPHWNHHLVSFESEVRFGGRRRIDGPITEVQLSTASR
jgi:hypothetical protein